MKVSTFNSNWGLSEDITGVLGQRPNSGGSSMSGPATHPICKEE
jgi:hypothetical protein